MCNKRMGQTDVYMKIVVRFVYKNEVGILTWKSGCGIFIVILEDWLHASLYH